MKTLLIAGLSASAGLTAYANLSETVRDSYAHYGRPVYHGDNTYTFRIGKWTIFEWVNPSTGKVAVIEYMLNSQDTKIGETGYNELTQRKHSTLLRFRLNVEQVRLSDGFSSERLVLYLGK
jgi:hypothetical protein